YRFEGGCLRSRGVVPAGQEPGGDRRVRRVPSCGPAVHRPNATIAVAEPAAFDGGRGPRRARRTVCRLAPSVLPLENEHRPPLTAGRRAPGEPGLAHSTPWVSGRRPEPVLSPPDRLSPGGSGSGRIARTSFRPTATAGRSRRSVEGRARGRLGGLLVARNLRGLPATPPSPGAWPMTGPKLRAALRTGFGPGYGLLALTSVALAAVGPWPLIVGVGLALGGATSASFVRAWAPRRWRYLGLVPALASLGILAAYSPLGILP